MATQQQPAGNQNSQWEKNYDYRGDQRAKYEPLTPEERAQTLAALCGKNSAEADAAEKFMRERGFEIAQSQQQAQPQVSTPISQAGQQIMPTDFQPQQGLLGTADDWQKAMAQYLAPFGGGGRGF